MSFKDKSIFFTLLYFVNTGCILLKLPFDGSQEHWLTQVRCHINSQPDTANDQSNRPVHEQTISIDSRQLHKQNSDP